MTTRKLAYLFLSITLWAVTTLSLTLQQFRPGFNPSIIESLLGLLILLIYFSIIYYLLQKKYPKGLKEAFKDIFFKTEDSVNIGFFRFLFCSYHFYEVLRMGGKLPGATFNPIPLFELFNFKLMHPSIFESLYLALLCALMLTAIGVYPRLFALFSAIGYFLFKGTLLSFTKSPFFAYTYHSSNIVTIVLLILSVSPGLTAFQFQPLKLKFVSSRGKVYTWASQLIIATIALVYFGAGYTKIISSPLWIDGNTLQAYLLEKYLYTDNTITLWFAQNHRLCVVASLLTILFEMSYVLILLYPRIKLPMILSAFAFHFATMKIMNINFFLGFFPVYFIYIKWSYLTSLKPFKFLFYKLKIDRKQITKNRSLFTTYIFGTRITVATLLTLVCCIFLRIESWPFSDYRVFQERTDVKNQAAYRFLGITKKGELWWLKNKHLTVSKTTISRNIRDAKYIANKKTLKKLTSSYINHDSTFAKKMFTEIIVIERKANRIDTNSFTFTDSVLFRLKPTHIKNNQSLK